MTTTKERATYGTEISSEYVGKRTRPPEIPGERPWEHHLWKITLTREGQSITFEYSAGTAHEQTRCGIAKPSMVSRYVPKIPCEHTRCWSAGWMPAPPTLYDALTSLKADRTGGETFGDWCRDFGMDTDSRKAMDLYLACQESEERSRRFFGSDWSAICDDEDYE